MGNKYFSGIFATLLFAAMAFVSCEKPIIENGDNGDGEEIVAKGECRITFNAMRVEQIPFNAPSHRAESAQSLTDVCSRISFVVFDGDKKVASVHQASSENSFGKVSMNLSKGTYTLVIVAHNGSAAPTFTSPSKISFKDNKVTDTFFYCANIDVEDSQQIDVTLKRAVAMFRLVVEDKTPAGVARMKFYYTGGSSTFDAVNGCGCVDSRQTEYRDVADAAHEGESSYEVYTFPHSDGRQLKMDVSALGASGDNAIYRQVFEDVPVKANQVTQYTGCFFGEDPDGGRSSITVDIDDEWTQKNFGY